MDMGRYSRSRRAFLKQMALAAGACSLPCGGWSSSLSTAELQEAWFYEPLGKNMVRCTLCPWNCVVPDGKRGNCGVRENRGGKYYTLVYGRPVAIHNDPIEKKPFMHVYPGSKALSIATVGCNIDCKNCQNWNISQATPEQFTPPFVSPQKIARLAKEQGAKTVAYTYTEPIIYYEYMYACAQAAKELGVGNVMVSNGMISEEPLKKLLPLMTAVKIDLKAFSEEFYQRVCGGRLDPVLQTLKRVTRAGVWLEIVVLVIPTLNDSDDEIRKMAAWIAKELGPNVPLHFIRFHPQYKMRNLPQTPHTVMERVQKAAVGEGLNFVYSTGFAAATVCPKCKRQLVDRFKYVVLEDNIQKAKCPECGAPIPGVWN